ncbi:lysophospholipid acyltransferase family protein [Solicola sp. PLA-1-18]|uniref:lysophospholipid acyltransferase family protein n=1 Tax=Solicola sp. PLA-1-18 TaxID=3380532 RepID=UPI003B826743
MADPAAHHEAEVADVVPIGTRGRPGRGSRSTSPSSAARSLAPSGGRRSAPTRRPTPAPEPDPAPADVPHLAAADPVVPRPQAPRDEPVADEVVVDEVPPTTAAHEPRVTADERGGPRIPVDELFSALLHGAQQVLGDDWERRAAEMVAALRRRLSGDYEIDAFGLDPQMLEIMLAALRPVAEKWFRVEVRGADNIPDEGGALIVANHSGTIPIDAAVTGLAVHDHAHRNLRLLGADLVFDLPFVGQLARKTGATLACNEDAERLLRAGHVAGVWPEGFKGIGKPYSERYKLQRFGRGGFVSAAMRTQVPIVPVSIVGAEEIYPLVGNVPSLARLLGVPYIPITPLFPLLGPLGLVPLPSKWIIEFGEPIRTDAYPADAADDPMLVFNVTDQVRETIQQTLYTLLVDRGHPFF